MNDFNEVERETIETALRYQLGYWKRQLVVENDLNCSKERLILIKSKIREYNSIYNKICSIWGFKSCENDI